jgi:hypothetical protein
MQVLLQLLTPMVSPVNSYSVIPLEPTRMLPNLGLVPTLRVDPLVEEPPEELDAGAGVALPPVTGMTAVGACVAAGTQAAKPNIKITRKVPIRETLRDRILILLS